MNGDSVCSGASHQARMHYLIDCLLVPFSLGPLYFSYSLPPPANTPSSDLCLGGNEYEAGLCLINQTVRVSRLPSCYMAVWIRPCATGDYKYTRSSVGQVGHIFGCSLTGGSKELGLLFCFTELAENMCPLFNIFITHVPQPQ